MIRKVYEGNFKASNPSTFPDAILELPPADQLTQILLKTEIGSLQARRDYEPGVHMGEGVCLPVMFNYKLSANLRFLFQVKQDQRLPENSYNEFITRLRWKWYWYVNGDNSEDWDPELRSRFVADSKDPPQGNFYFEAGLAAGRTELRKQVSSVVPQYRATDALNWDTVKSLKKFLGDSNYIVKGTDKNLGISVVTKQWYTEQCLKHLESDIFTECAKDKIPFLEFNDTIAKIRRADAGWNKQERDYLLDSFSLTDIPTFHGIPKIHKKPWGMRPIVPSHSWVSSPSAKLVSKYLKPAYAKLPWIIQSTREFVDLIGKVKLTPGKKVYMCTGDVAAMYTNIDKSKARRAAQDVFEHFKLPTGKVDALLSAIDMANNHNYVEFNGRIFHQEKGLAMGTACSPDLANLALGGYEQVRKIPFRKGILLYARYIDDIFALVEAESEQEARSYCLDHIGPLRLSWEVSDTRIHFLDVEVYISSDKASLCYKPYRKPLNHYSRIPWSSSHPKHVKKSVFSGELARLAINSSNRDNYLHAAAEFRNVLRLRGWPTEVLRA